MARTEDQLLKAWNAATADRPLVLADGETETFTNALRRMHRTRDIKPKMLAGSDNLPGGVNGIINHADGKRYDSKSAYAKAVKAKGCQIVGNDWNGSEWKPPLERGIRGDFNVRPELKEAVQRVLGT